MDYPSLKALHLLFVGISLVGFFLRAVGRFRDHGWLDLKPVRIAPHVIDTGLLATGIWLWVMTAHGMAGWLIIKLICVIVYIVAGVFVFRAGSSRASRLAALLIAILALVGTLALAVQKPLFL